MRVHPFAGMNRISKDIESWELREVFVESLEYQELLRLRFDELRRPLDLEWTEAEGEADKLDRHFGLYFEEVLVGSVVVLFPHRVGFPSKSRESLPQSSWQRGARYPTAQENNGAGDRKRDFSYAFRQGLRHWGRSGAQGKLAVE